LVEDDPSILKLGKMMMENIGYNVISANMPSKAIDMAKGSSGNIHLLITDLVMPEMNGRDLADQLRAIIPELKILFISGYTDKNIAQQGELEEGVFFIPKPFTKQELAGKIREVLGK
jgi:two-component system cell cycle sensor histidine kinase/response regulator CckA